jgi:hypothetical protein
MKAISVRPIVGPSGGNTANQGESIIFGLKMKEGETENFVIPYDSLWPLITNLLQLGNDASALREANPLHKGTQSGFVLPLDSISINPNPKNPGWHILECRVRTAQGIARYLIGADQTRLQNMIDHLRQYLSLTKVDPAPDIQH